MYITSPESTSSRFRSPKQLAVPGAGPEQLMLQSTITAHELSLMRSPSRADTWGLAVT
jgi:hypothetical protein